MSDPQREKPSVVMLTGVDQRQFGRLMWFLDSKGMQDVGYVAHTDAPEVAIETPHVWGVVERDDFVDYLQTQREMRQDRARMIGTKLWNGLGRSALLEEDDSVDLYRLYRVSNNPDVDIRKSRVMGKFVRKLVHDFVRAKLNETVKETNLRLELELRPDSQ